MYSHNLFGGSPGTMYNVMKFPVVSASVSCGLLSPRPSRELRDKVKEGGISRSVSLIIIMIVERTNEI